DAALKIGKADGELLEHLGLSDAALKLYTDGQTTAAQATKKHADEVARLNTEWNRLATASALSGVKGESTLAMIASNMAAQGITGRPPSASLVGPDKLVGSSLLSKFAGSRLLGMYSGTAPNVTVDRDNISGRMGGG